MIWWCQEISFTSWLRQWTTLLFLQLKCLQRGFGKLHTTSKSSSFCCFQCNFCRGCLRSPSAAVVWSLEVLRERAVSERLAKTAYVEMGEGLYLHYKYCGLSRAPFPADRVTRWVSMQLHSQLNWWGRRFSIFIPSCQSRKQFVSIAAIY